MSQRLHHCPPTPLTPSGWFPGCWSWTPARIVYQQLKSEIFTYLLNLDIATNGSSTYFIELECVSECVATNTLAWRIPWMEEPGRLQYMGSPRVRHDWATSLSCIGEGNGNSLQCSCLENPRDRGSWWAAVYGVTHSRIRLKRLSSSSSRMYYGD